MSLSSTGNPDALPQLVGDFQPVDVWQAHINTMFYGLRGDRVRDFYQTFVAADYRLAYALADDYVKRCVARDAGGQGPQSAGPLVVMEWGAGNGNLAACFLDRLQALDHAGAVFPRVTYVCVEREPVLMQQAQANPDLAKHRARVRFEEGSIEAMGGYADGTVDRILCNELWGELPTKLILRKDGNLQEEYLRPNLVEHRLADFPDWPQFVGAFEGKDLEVLKTLPNVLDDLVWEREYRQVEVKEFPFRRTIVDCMQAIDDEVLVPYNVGACQSLTIAKRLLSPRAVGFSSFDAGTDDLRVLNNPEKPCYMVQGGQFSFMLNYHVVQAVAQHLGIARMGVESQRDFVGRSLGETVMSVMDLLASHPAPPEGPAWMMDRLILQTLHALNQTYVSPYVRSIDFPVDPHTPDKERQELEALVASLSPRGVPDTIAYLTESELMRALPDLEALGFDAEGIRAMLQLPPQPVDYVHCHC